MHLKKTYGMKRFKILCTLLATCIIAVVVYEITSAIVKGFGLAVDLFNFEQVQKAPADNFIYLDLISNRQSDYAYNEVNTVTGDSILLMPVQANIFMQPSGQSDVMHTHCLNTINSIINLLTLAMYCFVIVLAIVTVVNFARSHVYEQRSIRRVNIIGIMLIACGMLSTLWNGIRVYAASSVVKLTNYVISYNDIYEWTPLLIGLVVLVMNEILRQATTMKEEQEFTI